MLQTSTVKQYNYLCITIKSNLRAYHTFFTHVRSVSRDYGRLKNVECFCLINNFNAKIIMLQAYK